MANLSLPTWIRSMERDPVRTLRSWCWWRPMTTMRRSTPWRSSSSSAWVAEMTSPESGPPRVLGSSCHCNSLTGFELAVYWDKQLPWDKPYSCGVYFTFYMMRYWKDLACEWIECRRVGGPMAFAKVSGRWQRGGWPVGGPALLPTYCGRPTSSRTSSRGDVENAGGWDLHTISKHMPSRSFPLSTKRYQQIFHINSYQSHIKRSSNDQLLPGELRYNLIGDSLSVSFTRNPRWTGESVKVLPQVGWKQRPFNESYAFKSKVYHIIIFMYGINHMISIWHVYDIWYIPIINKEEEWESLPSSSSQFLEVNEGQVSPKFLLYSLATRHVFAGRWHFCSGWHRFNVHLLWSWGVVMPLKSWVFMCK